MGPLERARRSLDGLSVGDAFGERFFDWANVARIRHRALPPPPWRWTDDTQMALSIVDTVAAHGRIDQDDLARRFAERCDSTRGYGHGTFRLLEAVYAGRPWRTMSYGGFGGAGSFGNGAAMRVAPLGAYFADDVPRLVEEARLSAEVTHAHADGIAGAIAVAVAAALFWQQRDALTRDALVRGVLEHTPPGSTHDAIARVLLLPEDCDIVEAAAKLGNGSDVSAVDTVPLCLWSAARHHRSYVDAMWTTVSALGDRDTTCAIVGGLVVLGADPVPSEWLAAREALA